MSLMTGLMAAGMALSAVSSISQGFQQQGAYEAQATASRYNQMAALENAAAARENAAATREAGKYEEEKQRQEGLRLLGAQRAAYGKAGVTMEGTPLEVVSQTAGDLEKEALAIRYNYGMQESQYLNQESRYQSQANYYGFEAERNRSLAGSAVGTGFLGAGTSLLLMGGQWAGLKSGSSLSSLGKTSVTGSTVPGLAWNPV